MSYGYSRVTGNAFVGFRDQLNQGAWAPIVAIAPATTWEELIQQPQLGVCKGRLTRALAEVARTMSLDGNTLTALDDRWDGGQRRFHFRLAFEEAGPDGPRKDTAERIRGALMDGKTTGQTRMTYQEEVDFGRRQIELAKQPDIRDAIALLGLQDAIDEIRVTTEALAEGIRTGQPKHISIISTLRQCARTFDSVHEQLDDLKKDQPDNIKIALNALTDPMNDLLDRFRT